ncbi:MAG: hypothetical protein RIK87_07080 [Fuerstiella sp.]
MISQRPDTSTVAPAATEPAATEPETTEPETTEHAAAEPAATGLPPFCVVLCRYGAVPQVARFSVSQQLYEAIGEQLERGIQLVVHTDRGLELATLLEIVQAGILTEQTPVTGSVLRVALPEDLQSHRENCRQAELQYVEWLQRLDDWQLQLQLIDMEWTLDQQQVLLYVLNGQNAETTRLALLAAAAGLGIIHVQPVAAEGIVQQTGGGGGCGSGGCGSGGCSSKG